jgi:hypothetical protein
MTEAFLSPSPGEPPNALDRLHQIHEFWRLVYVGEDPGEANWGELDALYGEVTAALTKTPMDIAKAESLTVYAGLLMTGQTEL